MATITGISGSLREASYNTALLRAAAQATPDSCPVDVVSIREIPLYDGDNEDEWGVPRPVLALQDAIARADGLLIVTPEYNHGVPGVLKNAMDWASRGPRAIQSTSAGKPVAVMGASPGARGTALAQQAWFATLRALGLSIYGEKAMFVGKAAEVFTDGKLTDQLTQQRLEKFMQGFAKFVEKQRV